MIVNAKGNNIVADSATKRVKVANVLSNSYSESAKWVNERTSQVSLKLAFPFRNCGFRACITDVKFDNALIRPRRAGVKEIAA